MYILTGSASSIHSALTSFFIPTPSLKSVHQNVFTGIFIGKSVLQCITNLLAYSTYTNEVYNKTDKLYHDFS